MGLDLTHKSRHGMSLGCAYSGFHQFRTALCAAAGYGRLDQYQGFDAFVAHDKVKPCVHWRTDPLWALINHSDCDGVIAGKRNLRGIARRLRELAPRLEAWHGSYALRLARMCDRCAELGEPLEFC